MIVRIYIYILQEGIIIDWNESSGGCVYSAKCGSAVIPQLKDGHVNYQSVGLDINNKKAEPWFETGTIASYNAILSDNGNWVAVDLTFAGRVSDFGCVLRLKHLLL